MKRDTNVEGKQTSPTNALFHSTHHHRRVPIIHSTMSSSVTDPTNDKNTASATPGGIASSSGKGKAKAADVSIEDEEEEEEEEEGDEDEAMGSDDEAEDEEEEYEEIDPSAIVGRRTRGVKVDYTSKEALEKAGLQGTEDDDEEDADVQMKH
ncbi:unnamed protein product [Cyclocybe aegerita]|uniref:Histone chaperone domain-containing protein n=1 Tax=Cyclocybe aegerita TaxID=1973307 RepID=A0A8S0VTM8_CYCAE|nr:unnamed protein product [Cyclocybe aegerita]